MEPQRRYTQHLHGGSIVVGTDGSDSATFTVRQAATLARSADAVLHIVSAFDARPDAKKRRLPESDAHVILNHAEEGVRGSGIVTRLHAIAGDPAKALCAVAARERASLIAVGNRGAVRPLHIVRSRVCDRVQRGARCGVLVIDTEPYWRPVKVGGIPGDGAIHAGATSESSPRVSRRWKVLIVASIGVFMAMLDVTIVNVAFPSIRRSFPRSSLGDLSWVLNSYNVVIAALLVPAGRLADRFGRRRAFFAGLWSFLAGSVICGAAGGTAVLIGGRVIQAVGAAILIPASLGLALAEFPPVKRARATSVWAAAGAAAAAAGPSLGGVLVQSSGWRWTFFINLGVALAVLPGRRLLVERRNTQAATPPDLFGAIVLAGGVGALALGIVKAPDWGWGSGRVLGCLLAFVCLMATLVVRSRSHPSPVLERELMRVRLFAQANVAFLAFSTGFYALLLGNVLYLTEVWRYSILEAGFAVTPAPIVAALAAVAGGRLTERLGPRRVVFPGTLLFAGACLLYRELSTATPDFLAHWLPAQIVSGAAIGLVFSGLTSASVMDLPPNRLATGTAVASCFRQVGAVLGIAALVDVVGAPAPAHLLAAFDHAWLLMALTGIMAAGCAFRFTSRRPGEAPEAEPLQPRRTALDVPGMERREIILHGQRMSYRTAGSGPPMLLIHGLLESSTTWRRLGPALALAHTVIAPDLLGHGDSDSPRDGDYSPSGHAGRVRDLLDALRVGRVTVVGHSLGAGIGMAFAYHYPDRVERLALVASGGFGPELGRILRLASVPGAGPLLRWLSCAPACAALRVLSALCRALGRRALARALRATHHTLHALTDASRRDAFLKSVRAVVDLHGQSISVAEHFKRLTSLPVIVVWGTRDQIIPVEHALRAGELHPSAEIVLLDGVGHHPHLAQPAYVAQRLIAFASSRFRQ